MNTSGTHSNGLVGMEEAHLMSYVGQKGCEYLHLTMKIKKTFG